MLKKLHVRTKKCPVPTVSSCTFPHADDLTATKEKGQASVFCLIGEHATAV